MPPIKVAQLELLGWQPSITRELDKFKIRWAEYEGIRDRLLLLNMQGRAKEALELEASSGTVAFDGAAAALNTVKRELLRVSSKDSSTILASLGKHTRRVQASVACTVFFVAAFLLVERKRKQTLLHLNQTLRVAAIQGEWLATAVKIEYDFQQVYIKHLFTHAEYDKRTGRNERSIVEHNVRHKRIPGAFVCNAAAHYPK